MRSLILRLAGRAKAHRLTDRFLRYNPFVRPHVQKTIRQFHHATPAERQQTLTTLLQRTLNHAQRTQHGKQRGSDLAHWPIITKAEIKQQPQAFFTRSIAHLPASTSGTSGTPLLLRRSIANVATEQAFIDSLLAPYGLEFRRSRIAVLRGDLPRNAEHRAPPFGSYRDSRYLVLSSAHLTMDNLSWYVDTLDQYRPDVLWIYPTAGGQLAELCLIRGTRLNLPLVLSSSEYMSNQTWQSIASAFKCSIVDYYGQAERVCLAYRTSPSDFRFVPTYGLVELKPQDVATSSTANERHARIIATGYWNSKMPLVRYDTGDLIAIPENSSQSDLDRICSGEAPFSRIIGRESEYLDTPSGARIQALNNIPRDISEISQVQFVQYDARSVELRVRPSLGFETKHQRQLMDNARARIPPEVDIVISTSKPLLKDASGKTPFVVKRRGLMRNGHV